MTLAEFLKEFDPVIAAFGHQKFPGVVLERINKKLFDFTAKEVWELNDLILDHCEHAPKPAKIIELAQIIRGKRTTKIEPFVYKIECQHCWDMGITRVQMIDDSLDVLMRCTCRFGDDQEPLVALPQYSFQAGQLFKRSAPPISWFKPESWQSGKAISITTKEIREKVEYWREKVSIAEKYWCSHIPELAEIQKQREKQKPRKKYLWA